MKLLIPSFVYPLLYIFLFCFIFLPWYSDSGQTTAASMLMSFFIGFQTIILGLAIGGIYYLILRRYMNPYLLIVLLCVITGIIAGDKLLFGLMDKTQSPNDVTLLFKQKREIALSCSAILSGIGTGILLHIASKNAT